MTSRTVYLALVLLLSACGPTVEVTPLSSLPTVRPSKAPVQVFTSTDSITRPYHEVALISVDDGWNRPESELLNLLIERASEIGADGLILLGQETRSSGGVLVPSGNTMTYVDSTHRVFRGSAIVFTDGE